MAVRHPKHSEERKANALRPETGCGDGPGCRSPLRNRRGCPNLNRTGQLIRDLAMVDLHWVNRLRGEPVFRDLQEGPLFDRQGKIFLPQEERPKTGFRNGSGTYALG